MPSNLPTDRCFSLSQMLLVLPLLLAMQFVTKLAGVNDCHAADDVPADAGKVGFRKFELSYEASEEARRRDGFSWYPSTKAAARHDYRLQIGFAAEDAEVEVGRHPLILFSHGFVGAGDQVIFLMEALARSGYIVAAVNHADAIKNLRLGRLVEPKFADAKSWTDQKFRDRHDDIVALLDHLLALDRDEKSFLFGRVEADQIGVCGHSLGGYTAFGLAGAWPSWRDERIKAALLMSPYSMPFLTNGDVKSVAVPVMIQGGTLDLGITPFQHPIYAKLNAPKYFMILKAETHLGWTNLASLGRTTLETAKAGNPQLIVDYSVAFFDRHLRKKPANATELLDKKNERLDSYRFESK